MKFFPAFAAVTALVCAPLHAQAPSAQSIIEGARVAATLTRLDEGLVGNLTRNGKRVPIALYLKEKNIQFQFSENSQPYQVFHMRLSDESYDLFQIVDGKTTRFPAKRITEAIADTDLTYEDLALRFFYWPNPILDGEEDVNGRACYKIRLTKPKKDEGRYEAVYVWIDKQFGAFMRIRGHDKSGGLVKEFQVEDVMEVAKGIYTLRKMQVSTHDPKTNRRNSITDVVFDKPKKAGPQGLR